MTRDSNKNGGAAGSPSPTLTLFKCGNSHTFFYPHNVCPECGNELIEIKSPNDAVLVSRTTVRVSPTGSPFELGLARVESGAKTLCIIEEGYGDTDTDEVVLFKKNGLFHASGKTDDDTR